MQVNIGTTIARLRREHNMKQEELAEQLDVTPQAVSKWENCASMPDITLIPKIAAIFNVTIDELFSTDTAEKPVVQLISSEKRKSFDEMILRIRVQDGGDKINVNLPLPIIKLALEMGMNTYIGNVNLASVDFNQVIKLVEAGVIGKLVEVEGEDGETIVIEVC